MGITSILLTVLGLMLFEIISSIDNAVINAEVLSSLPAKNRRWFLRWGLLLAVIGMRGLLPWLIMWLAVPSNGPLTTLSRTLYSNESDLVAVHASTSLLLTTGGTALLLIFLYWFFIEHHSSKRHHVIRFTCFLVSLFVLLGSVSAYAHSKASLRAIVIGIILFLVLLTTKRLAALPKQHMSTAASRRAKMTYLEVLDTIFSVEGVLGAFAFTFSVPLILIGNGIGAIIVRYATAMHGKEIRNLLFLKRGAMYAMGFIGVIMILHGLGADIPGWFIFLTTLISMGLAYLQE